MIDRSTDLHRLVDFLNTIALDRADLNFSLIIAAPTFFSLLSNILQLVVAFDLLLGSIPSGADPMVERALILLLQPAYVV